MLDGRAVSSIRPTALAAKVKSKLHDTAHADRDDHDRSGEGGGEKGHGNRYSPRGGEEFNAYVIRVLRYEINERHAKKYGDDDPRPRG